MKPWVWGAIADEAHYAQLLDTVGQLMDNTEALERCPLDGLVELLAARIRDYESRAHPWPYTSTPASVLASLMQEHGITQSQLPEVGAQSVVSAVLAGKRALDLRQVRALAQRFSVPMEVFVA